MGVLVPPRTHRLRAQASEVAPARRWAGDAARAAGLDEATAADLELAASEALTNAVMHAYPDREPGWIDLEAHVRDGAFLLVVCDDGVGMRHRDDSPGAGYGCTLIDTLATCVTRHRAPGGGVKVTMGFAL